MNAPSVSLIVLSQLTALSGMTVTPSLIKYTRRAYEVASTAIESQNSLFFASKNGRLFSYVIAFGTIGPGDQ